MAKNKYSDSVNEVLADMEQSGWKAPEPLKSKEASKSEKATGSDLQDTLLGASQGATLGFADEIEGAVRGGYGALSGEEGSIHDLYRKYQKLAEHRAKESEERSPWLYGAGNLAGAFLLPVPGAVTGGMAKGAMSLGTKIAPNLLKGAAAKGLLKGAVEGATLGGVAGVGTSSETGLDSIPDALRGSVEGGLAGGVIGGIAGKLMGQRAAPDYLAATKGNTDTTRSLESFEHGFQGKPKLISGEALTTAREELKSGGLNLAKKIKGVDSETSAAVGTALKEAEAIPVQGLKEEVTSTLLHSSPAHIESPVDNEALKRLSDRINKTIEEQTRPEGTISAEAAHSVIDHLNEVLNKFKGKDEGLRERVNDLKKSFQSKIPSEYKTAIDNLGNSRTQMEDVLSLVNNKNERKFISDMSTEELGQYLTELAEAAGSAGTGQADAKTALARVIKHLEEAGGSIGGLHKEDLNQLVGSGFKYGLVKQAAPAEAQAGEGADIVKLGKAVLHAPIGIAQAVAGGSPSLRAYEAVGRAAGNIKRASNYSGLPKEAWQGILSSLEANSSPTTANYASKIRTALEANDSQSLNAVQFVMMQNPTTRSMLGLSNNE